MEEKDKREGWNKVGLSSRKPMEGDRRKQKEILSIEDGREYKTKVSGMIELREKRALRQKVEEEEHLKIYGGLREGI